MAEPNFTQPGEIGSGADDWSGTGPRQMSDGRWWSPESGWIVDEDQVNREFQQNSARMERHAAPMREYNPHEDAARFGQMSDPRFTSGPQIDTTRPDESRGISMDALSMLKKRADGAETPAQRLQAQQTAGAVAGIQSGAASIKGGAMARAAAGAGAQQTGARIQMQGNQDQAALRAREMADASNQYFGAAQGQRGRDLGLATSQADFDAKQRAANEQRDQFYQGLKYDQNKTTVDDELGRTAAQSAAENASRTAGLNESNAAFGRATQVASGGLGAIQGGVSAYNASQNEGGAKKSDDPWDPKNYSNSDPNTKRNIVPLYEDAGSGIERHWDADRSKSKKVDVTSGASLSGPAPKYSSAPRETSVGHASRPKSAPKTRKYTNAELKKLGESMLANVTTQRDAQLAGGPAVERNGKSADYDGRYLGSPFPEPKKEVKSAPNFKDVLDDRFGSGGEDRGDPYKTPPPPKGVTGAPKGYAASRNGQMGSMFGSTMRPEYSLGSGYSDDPDKNYESHPQIRPENQWAPGSSDLYAGSHARDLATSDPAAKRAAFIEGMNHASDAADTGTFGKVPDYMKNDEAGFRDASVVKPQPPKEARRAASSGGARDSGRKEEQARYNASMEQGNEAARGNITTGALLGPAGTGAIAVGANTLRENQAINESRKQGPRAGEVPMASPPAEDPGAWSNLVARARGYMPSDPKTKNVDDKFGGPMAAANRSMEPSSYEYKPEYLPPEQEPGETNVGPMADKMKADPVAGTAIVRDPKTGMLAIDKTKALKLTMGGLASLQRQVDHMGGHR